jgi:hypothetical protein
MESLRAGLLCGLIGPASSLLRLLMDCQVDTYSEEWRHECEARAVLNMPLLDGQNYLQLVEEKRGKSARDYLQVKVRELWITKYRSLNR